MAMAMVGVAALAAAMVMVGMVLVRRFRRVPPLGEDAAVQAAEAAIPGFAARVALVGDDRRAALVVGEQARVALVGRDGRAQEVRWHDVRAAATGLSVASGGRLTLVPGVDVLDVRRAGGDDLRPTRA